MEKWPVSNNSKAPVLAPVNYIVLAVFFSIPFLITPTMEFTIFITAMHSYDIFSNLLYP